jgi:ATP-dependent DNA helicase RecQ
MQDQVQALKQNGVKAEALNSNLTYSQKLRIEEQIKKGELKLRH